MSRKVPDVSRARSGDGGLRRKSPAHSARASKSADAPHAANAPRKERLSQFTLKLRESLHRDLAKLALENGMTMRGFIMNALKSKGLDVREEDLVDRRKR